MKRLQFRHREEVFENRQSALEFFSNIVNENRTECVEFGTSLYSEPLVARYKDDNNNIQVLFAIGVGSGHTAYHIIDSAKIVNDIAANSAAIVNEKARAMDAEDIINGEIDDINETIAKNVATIVKLSGVSSNVRDEFVLKNANGDVLGEHIKVYKDSALVAAQIGHKNAELKIVDGEYVKDANGKYVFLYENEDTNTEWLYLIYSDSEGQLQMVGIDFEQFILEAEFGNGFNVNEHNVSLKLDSDSEEFLSLSENGLKLDGVQGAIEAESESALTAAKQYTDSKKVSIVNVTSTITDSSVKSAFELRDLSGNTLGDTIKIYNEGDLKNVYVGTVGDTVDANGNVIEGTGEKALCFIYFTNGGYTLVSVGLSDYFTETIFGNGLSTEGSVVAVKKAAGSENYLEIDTAGIAIVGVNAAIASAKTAAIAESDSHLNTKAAEIRSEMSGMNQALTSEIESVNQDLASDISGLSQSLATETTNRQNADTLLQNTIISVQNMCNVLSASVISDVDYSSNTVRLKLANGTYTVGFDASDFLKDSVLSNVELEGENLKFTWNDVASSTTVIALSKFSDIYESGDDYVKVSGKVITVKVDTPEGLATVSYVGNAVNNAISGLPSNNWNAAYNSAHSHSNKDVLDGITAADVLKWNGIDTLNGDEDVQGSVKHIVSDKFASDLITNGLPATDITIEEARQNSLLRKVNLNDGTDRYYASNNANDMLYQTSASTYVNLNTYINGLETRIYQLEAQLAALVSNLSGTVRTIVNGYIEGTDNEITVAETNNKLKIGFAEDAIFGEE